MVAKASSSFMKYSNHRFQSMPVIFPLSLSKSGFAAARRSLRPGFVPYFSHRSSAGAVNTYMGRAHRPGCFPIMGFCE